MNQDPVRVRQVQWTRVFPGLLLLRSVGIGCSLQVLIPAFLYLLVAAGGRQLIGGIAGELPIAASPELLERADSGPAGLDRLAAVRLPVLLVQDVALLTQLLTNTAACAGQNVAILVWDLAWLAFWGVAIARCAAAAFCVGVRTGVRPALQYSAWTIRRTCGATVIAAAIVAGPLLLCWLGRGVYAIPAVGPLLVAIGWPLLVALAVCAVLAALVGGIGWLLSLGAIGTDRCSGSDGLSRGLSYVLSHPWLTLLYLVLILLLMVVVDRLATAVLLAADVVLAGQFATAAPSRAAAGLVSFWTKGQWLIPDALQLGVGISGITIAYVLLRQAEDGIRLREIDGDLLRPRPDSVGLPS